MNKLRDKTHIILIVLVLAFLGTIVFEWGMDYLGMRSGQNIPLGIVNGDEITAKEFDDQVKMYLEQQKRQTGEDPDESMIQMIRNQVWDQMVAQKIIEQQIKKFGIEVTNQEITNWVYNSPLTLPEDIKQNFIDSTGQFNMAFYQQALQTKTPEVQQFWSSVEVYLKQRMLIQKLESIILGSIKVTEGEVIQKFKEKSIKASFDYVFLDASSIPDNQTQFSEEDLHDYYDKHKDEYKRVESSVLKYVMFSDAPVKEDSLALEKQLNILGKELKKLIPGDSTTYSIVDDNSITKFEDKFMNPTEFPTEVLNFLISAKKDSVSDVIKANDGFNIVRLIDVKEGTDIYSNSSHILVNFGSDTAAAKLKAEQILERINKGDNFSLLASELSDDEGTKVNGGQLGWFKKGVMVKEFDEAVLNAPIGSVIGPVKTQFGFHIIKVNDRQKKEFKAALIKKPVQASTRTKEAARKKAEDFSYISRNGNFEEEAKKINIQILDIPQIYKGAFIAGIGNNPAVTDFALNEKKGSVSDPVKINNGYGVFLLVNKIPEGYSSFEEVKTSNLIPGVIQKKKLEILKQSLADLKAKITNNNLASLSNIDQNIKITSVDSMTIAIPPPAIGIDYDLFNSLYQLNAGQISEPITTSRGCYLVQMNSITQFDQAKYNQENDALRIEILNQKKQTFFQDWIADLKEKSVIVDNRSKFGL